MKSVISAKILKNEAIGDDIYDMTLFAPAIAKEARAGQFVNVYIGAGEFLLPRPISICQFNKEKGTLRLVFQIVGKGTKLLSWKKQGDTLKILGPLGNGFDTEGIKGNGILVGGGIGVPPMLQLAQELKGNCNVFIGARIQPILVQEFQTTGASVHIATDNGSVGLKGNVVDLLNSVQPSGGILYACGPKVMLKFTAQWALKRHILAYVSMEERMACGIGACVGCTVKIQKQDETDWQYLKVCKDGPVFDAKEVIWDD